MEMLVLFLVSFGNGFCACWLDGGIMGYAVVDEREGRLWGAIQRGYTLIELLVVLVIVGILAAAGVYYHADRNGPAVRGTLVAVAQALGEARTMARGTGQTVTLTPSGSGASLALTYQVTGGPSGQYAQGADRAAYRFCVVDVDGTSAPTSDALDGLKSAIGDVKAGGSSVFTAAMWTTNVFNAASNVQILSNGCPNTAAYIAVTGAVNGTTMVDGPVGIVLLDASGNIYRYYRSSPGSTWSKL